MTTIQAYAREEQGHADRIAQRIVKLNGKPNFSRDGLVMAMLLKSTPA